MGQQDAWTRGNGNLLLESLPSADRALVTRHLEDVELSPRAALYDPDVRIEHVYFPTEGLVSMLGVFADGTGVETAIAGREAMVGMAVFHGTDRIAEQAVVQLRGRAHRMPADALRACLTESPALQQALHHYAACIFMFAAQSVACMSKHETTRRLARWLLHACDHSGTDDLDLTHLFLSHMLGVRRSSVTVAASTLRSKGLITYTRKRIAIADRTGLTEYSCVCYRIVRSTYDRLVFGQATVSPLADVESSRNGISTLGSPHPEGARGGAAGSTK
jgi:CRP-like cAMP-binding protein